MDEYWKKNDSDEFYSDCSDEIALDEDSSFYFENDSDNESFSSVENEFNEANTAYLESDNESFRSVENDLDEADISETDSD